MIQCLLGCGLQLNKAVQQILERHTWPADSCTYKRRTSEYFMFTKVFAQRFPNAKFSCQWDTTTLEDLYKNECAKGKGQFPDYADEVVSWLLQANLNKGTDTLNEGSWEVQEVMEVPE